MTQGPVTLTITVTNKTHLGQTSLAETISKVKNSSVLEILIFFLGQLVVATVIVINSVIGRFS